MTDRKRLAGPTAVRYFMRPLDRLDCRIREVPEPWKYWDVYWDGEHVGHILKGKGGIWHGMLFATETRRGRTFRARKWAVLGLHLVGVLNGPQ